MSNGFSKGAQTIQCREDNLLTNGIIGYTHAEE
jgi:hypothetical protein